MTELNFGAHQKFRTLDDGTIYARVGTQANCAGISGIHVRITELPEQIISFKPDSPFQLHKDSYGARVPGALVPIELREAVFRAARERFQQAELNIGICFELIDALVHEVDATERMFLRAGFTAMHGWLIVNGYAKEENS